MAALNPMAPAGVGPNTPSTPATNVGTSQKGTSFWGDDGFTFDDLVDLVNQLQHIPVVSWAYRAITGDQIAPGPMAIGGGLFGGLAGFSLGTAEAMIKGSSGKDGGETNGRSVGIVACTGDKSKFGGSLLASRRQPVLARSRVGCPPPAT